MAAKIANMKEGKPSKDTSAIAPVSQSAASDMLNVSKDSLKRAKHAIDKGSPAVIAAMESGNLPASVAAKFVDAVPDKKEQEKIAKQGADAIKKAAKKKGKPKEAKPKKAAAVEQAADDEPTPEPPKPSNIIGEFRRLFWDALSVPDRRLIKVFILEEMGGE